MIKGNSQISYIYSFLLADHPDYLGERFFQQRIVTFNRVKKIYVFDQCINGDITNFGEMRDELKSLEILIDLLD